MNRQVFHDIITNFANIIKMVSSNCTSFKISSVANSQAKSVSQIIYKCRKLGSFVGEK